MNIRLEQPSDYRKVENLTREAFWNVYRPGCYEHFVLNQFRNNPDFIPELGRHNNWTHNVLKSQINAQ